MRVFILTLGVAAALVWGAATAGSASVDLRGTARVAERAQPGAVIWLEAPNAPNAAATRPVLDQRNLSFSPHVLAVRVGSLVDFPNNDTVFHNVFSFRDGKKFDLGLYPVGTKRQVRFDQPGLSRIFCNIHPNMAAYVMAVDSPYFAVADDKGAFTISQVPEGTYTFHAWRPSGAELTGTIAHDGGRAMDVRWP